MPRYDYRCSSCGHAEEIEHKITAEPISHCPKCQQASFRRGPGGGSALLFRGPGFYVNDYARQSPTPAATGAATEGAAAGSSAAGSSATGSSVAESKAPCCPCGKNKGSCSA